MLNRSFTTLMLLVAPLALAAEFDVASIKPSAPPQVVGRISERTSTNTSTGNLTFVNVNLLGLVAQAFQLPQDRISGPDWLRDVRFDITATFTPGSTQEAVREMLQALLADRFAMKVHRETKELPIYNLVIARGGHKLKSASEAGRTSSTGNNGRVHFEGSVTMARFADYLSGRMGRPVVDRTELPGAFEITFDFAADDSLAANQAANQNDATLPALFTALPEQLGLRLESSKGPVEALVIDSASKTPTEN